MKQQNLAIFGAVAFMSIVFALLITTSLFAPEKSQRMEAESVDPISSNFPSLNKKYFNANSINPVQTIQIGDNPNENPFTSINPN